VLRLYLEAIPGLIARESMAAVRVVQVGSGQLKKDAAQRIVRGWVRDAQGGRGRARARPATPEMLRAMGIGVMQKPQEAPRV
jgi:hypothetical protein